MFLMVLFSILAGAPSQAARLVRVYQEPTFPQNAVVVFVEKSMPSQANCLIDFVSSPQEADFLVRPVLNNPREADVSVFQERQIPSRARIRVFEVKNSVRDPNVRKVYGTKSILLAASVCAVQRDF